MATYGILFFATPQRGFQHSKAIILMENLLWMLPGLRSICPILKAVKDLREDDEDITVLSSRFRTHSPLFKILNFYEQQKTRVIPCLGFLSPKVLVS
jgi:hypothetical protein